MTRLDTSRVWTTRDLLAWTTRHLGGRDVERPRLVAEILLSHVLDGSRLDLYIDPDRPATLDERSMFRGLVERAAAHEPVDYLLGRCSFCGLVLAVDQSVLIPRPSTETIVEFVTQQARRSHEKRPIRIADIGTGSGSIAVALATQIPRCRVIATDLSGDALRVAAQNARTFGVADRIEFRAGALFEPLGEERFDFLVSNPPYISDREWALVPRNVKNHEPPLALRAGPDGLDVIRPLVESASGFLQPDGFLAVEIASSQENVSVELASRSPGLGPAEILRDHEGLPRVLVAPAHDATQRHGPMI